MYKFSICSINTIPFISVCRKDNFVSCVRLLFFNADTFVFPNSLLGKRKIGTADNMDIIPNTKNPSHQAPIQFGSRGLMETSIRMNIKHHYFAFIDFIPDIYYYVFLAKKKRKQTFCFKQYFLRIYKKLYIQQFSSLLALSVNTKKWFKGIFV